jgi:hypothetical protein
MTDFALLGATAAASHPEQTTTFVESFRGAKKNSAAQKRALLAKTRGQLGESM